MSLSKALTAARVLLTAGVFLGSAVSINTPASAQNYELYAGLIKSTGYVVGSPLSRSGFHRYDGVSDTTWSHIGWNIPRVSALAFHPENKNTIYLACGNGVLRSRDGGDAWKIITGWQVTESQGIAIDPSAPEDVYVATAYGIWRSTDAGDTWEESNDGFEKNYTQNVAVDRTTPHRVFAATDGGIYVSNRGTDWTRVTEDVPILDIHQSDADPNIWIAATRGNGVWLSKDNGNTWLEVRSRRVRGKNIHAAVVDPTDASRMAAAGWQTGVLYSETGGASWKDIGGSLPSESFYELVFDPAHPGRLFAATIEEGIFYTDNGGRSWTSAGMFGTLFFDLQFVAMEDQ